MYRIENIKVREDLNKEELLQFVCKKYKIDSKNIISWSIFKKSIDARDKADVHYNYTIDIDSTQKIRNAKLIEEEKIELINFNNTSISTKPVIVGAGPAGIFCALTLVQNGIKPIIIEQGKKVEERINDVEEFRKSGKLNIQSNVQFGEGGAGTFSDGKLTSRSKQYLCEKSYNRIL